jgi:5-methylcytosine-specific restriction endonuclease McrA
MDAIDAALKPKRALRPARARRVLKKKTKKEQTSEIRAEVFARAFGACEMCGAPATELEHAFGRVRVPQAVSNCLALCRGCHVARTNSRPSALYWWTKYAAHFASHRYDAEESRALAMVSKRQSLALGAS